MAKLKKPVEAPVAAPQPVKAAEPAHKPVVVESATIHAPKGGPNESYKVIRRGDRYLVEIILYGRIMLDHKDYARPEDAHVRLLELQKGKP